MVVSQNRTQYRPHITIVLIIGILKMVPLFRETAISAFMQSHKQRILPKEKVQDKITTICEGFLKVAADSHECQSLRLVDAFRGTILEADIVILGLYGAGMVEKKMETTI